jgi:hypothetical protein
MYSSKNFLRTIQPIIKNERESINLPDKMLDIVMGESHAWVGMTQFDFGSNIEAIKHLLLSIKYKHWQPKLLGFVLLALLPRRMRERIRSHYANIKLLRF